MDNIKNTDPDIYSFIKDEMTRQENTIELIASENIVSAAVMEAAGTALTNKYAEGYPQKRYYGGCEHVDKVEHLAIERAKKLFDCNFANVQPHSGAQANQAAFFAFLNPMDKILSLSLDCGGHLTHGHSITMSGKWFEVKNYFVDRNTGWLNYDEIEEIAIKEKPKLIIAGYSAYPRRINFERFREIADKVGAYLMADIAHYAGLVAGKEYPSPLEYAHIVTTTTHKTLRGPRGGMLMWNDKSLEKKINSAVFPGMQGGPLMHIIAAKAVAFKEALTDEFSQYCKNVISNARTICDILKKKGIKIITDGTDSHMLLIDLRPNNLYGSDMSKIMEYTGLTCNKNSVPFDHAPPMKSSGIRIGTPAITTRGMGTNEMEIIGNLISELIVLMTSTAGNVVECIENNRKRLNEIKIEVKNICSKFPVKSF